MQCRRPASVPVPTILKISPVSKDCLGAKEHNAWRPEKLHTVYHQHSCEEIFAVRSIGEALRGAIALLARVGV